MCFVWSANQYTRDFLARVTADFLYVRFIGDRQLTKFDRIQLNRTVLLEECWRRLSSALDSVNEAFVFSNNHFAGFAPDTIREFRRSRILSKLTRRLGNLKRIFLLSSVAR